MTAGRNFFTTTNHAWSAKRSRFYLLCAILLAVALFLVFAPPAYAIANPDDIYIPTTPLGVTAYTNLWEQGDMLFVMPYVLEYATMPAGNASDFFGFYLYDTNGITLLGYFPAIDYGYRLTALYFSASDVLTRGMGAGAKYVARIAGTPLGFAGNLTEDVNMDTQVLGTSAWFTGSQSQTRADLKENLLLIMQEIEDHDTSIMGAGNATYLLQATQNTKILSSTFQPVTTGSYYAWSGKAMVLTAIPHLDNIIPDIFEGALQSFDIWTAQGTGALQAESTMASRLGTAFTNSFAGIGTYFGISTQWAAGIFWSIIMSIAAMIIFVYSGNSLAAMILVLPLLLMGNYLGIIPLVVTFVLTILLVVYMGYHIYLRGMV